VKRRADGARDLMSPADAVARIAPAGAAPAGAAPARSAQEGAGCAAR